MMNPHNIREHKYKNGWRIAILQQPRALYEARTKGLSRQSSLWPTMGNVSISRYWRNNHRNRCRKRHGSLNMLTVSRLLVRMAKMRLSINYHRKHGLANVPLKSALAKAICKETRADEEPRGPKTRGGVSPDVLRAAIKGRFTIRHDLIKISSATSSNWESLQNVQTNSPMHDNPEDIRFEEEASPRLFWTRSRVVVS